MSQTYAKYSSLCWVWKLQAILMESSSNFHTYQKCFQYFSDAIARRVYVLKSKLLESKENKIDDIEGRTMEEKTTNIIKFFWFKGCGYISSNKVWKTNISTRIRLKDKKRKVTVINASERLILSILWLSTRVDVYVSISFWSSSAQMGKLIKNRN